MPVGWPLLPPALPAPTKSQAPATVKQSEECHSTQWKTSVAVPLLSHSDQRWTAAQDTALGRLSSLCLVCYVPGMFLC